MSPVVIDLEQLIKNNKLNKTLAIKLIFIY